METAVATPAPLAAQDGVAFALRDVEDLHDADLDGVLADRLLDADVAAGSATAVADAVSGSGEAAISAHTLSARALLLALL